MALKVPDGMGDYVLKRVNLGSQINRRQLAEHIAVSKWITDSRDMPVTDHLLFAVDAIEGDSKSSALVVVPYVQGGSVQDAILRRDQCIQNHEAQFRLWKGMRIGVVFLWESGAIHKEPGLTDVFIRSPYSEAVVGDFSDMGWAEPSAPVDTMKRDTINILGVMACILSGECHAIDRDFSVRFLCVHEQAMRDSLVRRCDDPVSNAALVYIMDTMHNLSHEWELGTVGDHALEYHVHILDIITTRLRHILLRYHCDNRAPVL